MLRGLPSIVVGVGLLGLGAWILMHFGYNHAVLVCIGAGVVMLVRGVMGIGLFGGGDPTELAQFVTNPADAIVDSAIDKAADMIGEARKKEAEELPSFDVDAAFARYMANRPEPAANAMPQPVRGFGRKGI
jgi:hypothetical protein